MLEVKIKRKLKGFNLDVEFAIGREPLAILGPSGAGKTMTLLSIAGLVQPDEGFISLNDKVLFDSARNINLPPQERKVGFVFQQYALFPHLTISENIAYGIKHLDKREIKERVERLLQMVHISGLGHRYPRQISSGQQQRVALARALATEPELLLLDEPFSALDTVRKERLEMEMLSLQRSYHGNMLFVTHDLAQGYKLGTRMAIYDAGKIIQFDNKEYVIAAPVNRVAARLTGVKNLLNGIIVEVRKEDVMVNVPGLGKTIRSSAQDVTKLSTGQQITVGIRPEYIQLAGAESENTVSLTVDRIVAGVTSMDCRFLNGKPDFTLRASLFRAQCRELAGGCECLVYLPPEHIVIITE